MSDIPTFKLKSKDDCAKALKSMINTSSFTQSVEFVKFTMPIALTDTEVIVKLGDQPEIVDLLFAYQKTAVKRFDEARDFYVSYSSVLKFEKVEFDWMYGTMILDPISQDNHSPSIPNNLEVTQPLEQTATNHVYHLFPELSPESTEPLEPTQETSVIISEVSSEPPNPIEVTEQKSEVVEVIKSPAIYTNDSTVSPTITDDSESVDLGDLNVYVALEDTNHKQIKKKIDLPLKKFLPLLNGWLYCSQQLREFKQVLSDTPHNALTLYLNPPLVWYVQDVEYNESITLDTWLLRETKTLCDKLECTRVDQKLFDHLLGILTPSEFKKYQRIRESIVNKGTYHNTSIEVKRQEKQLRTKGQSSESVAEIRPQTKGSIQRDKRFSIPEIASIFQITPIKEVIDGQTYLVQEYIERDSEGSYTQKSQRIALFDGGQLLYYKDLETYEQELHEIKELITVDGITIFPSTSINQIRLESLECINPKEPIETHLYESKKRYFYTDHLGQPQPYSEAEEIPQHIKPRFVHSPNVFNRVLPPPPDTKKKPKAKIEPKIRKTPKPIKLENEKVVTGSLKFVDVIGTTPCIMKLNPTTTGYKLTALPVKLDDSYCYDLARYIAGNVPKMSAINYLHDRVRFLQSLSCDKFGGHPRTDLISMLNTLKDAVRDDIKINPQHFLTSKNKIREELNKSPFLTSTRDAYYGFYELALIGIKQEIETQEYQYRLTNLSPDDKAFYRHNLMSVLNFVRRVTYNLREHFGANKPDTGKIREYLQSKFNYSNCKLNIYWGEGKPRKGLIMEISYRGQVISEHLIQIIEPANLNPIYTRTNEEGKQEEHTRHYGIVPTKLSISPSFNDHNDDAIFYALLRCQKTDKELVTFAKAQLMKVINKYISANRNKLVGENKTAVQTTVAKSAGFIDTGHGYNAIKKTFLKFCIPYSADSLVNLGKFTDLKTLKPYSIHDLTFLLEKITAGWKQWEHSSDRTIQLAGIHVRKENPGKLMINVTKLLQDNPELTSTIWDDLINTFYTLSKLSLGFKCSNGVVLTPFDIYSDDLQRWTHRIKIQLISILKDGDNSRKLGIESLLQLPIDDIKDDQGNIIEKGLYSKLDKHYPSWNNNPDINAHLAELHDGLNTAIKLSQE